MENQHRKIRGYRELDQEEIDLMNEIKEQGVTLGTLIEKLHDKQNAIDAAEPTVPSGEARRWLSVGQTHLQQGLMALTRAVAKPDFF